MILIDNIMSRELLNSHLENGLVRRQVHPQYPQLAIYVYTEKAAFSKTWDEVTNQCRGLITVTEHPDTCDYDCACADDRNCHEYVLARGFNKFHNLNTEYIPETKEENLPNEKPLVTTKLDGSLGIIFKYDEKLHVATKGSFASDQSSWATTFLRENHSDIMGYFDQMANLKIAESTPLVEIIYPENRIVCDYKGARRLVLLGVVYNATGEDMPRSLLEDYFSSTTLPIVGKFSKSLAECAIENNKNEEGYVLTYPTTGLKIKVKFEDYCRLHKIVTGLNPRAVWELLSKKQVKELKVLEKDKTLPQEFRDWLKHVQVELKDRYRKELHSVLNQWAKLAIVLNEKRIDMYDPLQRKDLAAEVLKFSNHGLLFSLIQGDTIEDKLWDAVYPAGSDTFRKDGE